MSDNTSGLAMLADPTAAEGLETKVQHGLSPSAVELCACRCGRPAPIAKRTRRRNDHVKGMPVRFISGHNRRRDVPERFWPKVEKAEGDACWCWTARRDHDGYGQFSVDGRKVRAHRFSWELHFGPIPPGLQVRHVVCDNPPCVNPAHLGIGTAQDDANDKTSKGRQAKGEQVGGAKLTDVQVFEICRRRATGETRAVLAAAFSISQASVSRVAIGRTWAHLQVLPKPMTQLGRARGEQNGNARLTTEEVLTIRRRRATGEPLRSIARAFVVSCPTVHAIVLGRTWAHLPGQILEEVVPSGPSQVADAKELVAVLEALEPR